MKTIGNKLESFSVTGVKPGFNQQKKNGVSAFETITERALRQVEVIYLAKLTSSADRDRPFRQAGAQFEERDACCSAARSTTSQQARWRRGAKDLNKLGHWSFRREGSLVDQLGVRDGRRGRGAAGDLHRRRATT